MKRSAATDKMVQLYLSLNTRDVEAAIFESLPLPPLNEVNFA